MRRNIDPQFQKFLDDKILETTIAATYRFHMPEILICEAADFCTRIKNSRKNPNYKLIKSMLFTNNDYNPERWCMSFVQSVIAYTEYKLFKNSPIFASDNVLDVWERTPHNLRNYDLPKPGMIAIWKHRTCNDGHVGIVTEIASDSFVSIEGNVKSGRFDDKDIEIGDSGVWPHVRKRSGASKMDLLGFLRVF